jgi:uncharacterized membrane protein
VRRAAPHVGIASLAAGLLAWASIFRHDRFGSFGYDLGVFDQTIWGYSHLELVHNTVKRIPNLLGDHFHPILFTLAPLYWVWNDPRALLVAQAVLIAASSLPLAAWARRALGWPEALLLQVSYLLFWGLLAGVFFDFHELAFAPLALALCLYGLGTGADRVFLVGFVIALLTKEDLALTMFVVGAYAVVFQGRRRFGVAVAAISAAWFAVVVLLVMPALSGRGYGYWAYDPSPGHLLDRLATIAAFLGAWCALPLISSLLLITGPTFVEKLLTTTPSHYSTKFQYALVAAPVLAFATVDALRRISVRYRRVVTPLAVATLLAGVLITFVIVRPLAGLTGQISDRRADEILSCLETVPGGASVSATNALVPHLTHRREIYPIDAGRDTQYLAIDTSTSLARVSRTGVAQIVKGSLAEGYRVTCRRGTTVVLAR